MGVEDAPGLLGTSAIYPGIKVSDNLTASPAVPAVLLNLHLGLELGSTLALVSSLERLLLTLKPEDTDTQLRVHVCVCVTSLDTQHIQVPRKSINMCLPWHVACTCTLSQPHQVPPGDSPDTEAQLTHF